MNIEYKYYRDLNRLNTSHTMYVLLTYNNLPYSKCCPPSQNNLILYPMVASNDNIVNIGRATPGRPSTNRSGHESDFHNLHMHFPMIMFPWSPTLLALFNGLFFGKCFVYCIIILPGFLHFKLINI